MTLSNTDHVLMVTGDADESLLNCIKCRNVLAMFIKTEIKMCLINEWKKNSL